MGSKVLIIDDDSDFKRILAIRLKAFLPDLELTDFGDITSARDFITNNQDLFFDLVILDEHLPDGRGTEFLAEGYFENLAVLMLSSDTDPQIPGTSIQAGAKYFLNKVHVREPLFKPLVLGIIDRNKIQHQLEQSKANAIRLDTVKTLVSTLRHEINNPLGAVLGAAYLLRTAPDINSSLIEAAELVESSGKRIKHVLDELCEAMEIEPTTKAKQRVFNIPGDKKWE